jgi:hypothetical protein
MYTQSILIGRAVFGSCYSLGGKPQKPQLTASYNGGLTPLNKVRRQDSVMYGCAKGKAHLPPLELV